MMQITGPSDTYAPAIGSFYPYPGEWGYDTRYGILRMWTGEEWVPREVANSDGSRGPQIMDAPVKHG